MKKRILLSTLFGVGVFVGGAVSGSPVAASITTGVIAGELAMIFFLFFPVCGKKESTGAAGCPVCGGGGGAIGDGIEFPCHSL